MTTINTAQRTVNIPQGTNTEEAGATTQSPSTLSTTQAPTSTALPDQPPPTQTLQQLLANRADLSRIANSLRLFYTPFDGEVFTPAQVTYWMNGAGQSARNSRPTLATDIKALGFDVPRTGEEARTLAQKLNQMTTLHPLGDFGGGLTWPIPMAHTDQAKLESFFRSDTTQLPGLPLSTGVNGVLAYLMSGSPLLPSDLQDPVKAIEKLLGSPKAEALGRALQTHLGGASSDTSIYDYVLAAIHIGLEKKLSPSASASTSTSTSPPPSPSPSPSRNNVAGFNLATPALWGASATTVVDTLSAHLVTEEKATESSKKLATHLLLAKEAPQFLVKDIPASVTYGSLLWTQLTLAVAKVEQATPGRTPGMTYAQVMLAAQDLPAASTEVQRAAIIDWGVANKILVAKSDALYAPAEIESTRTAYNQQREKLKAAAETAEAPIPTRKQMALDWLKEQFPTIIPDGFEKKVISLEERPLPVGRPIEMVGYSLLDLTMEGERLNGRRRIAWNLQDPTITAFVALTRTPEFKVPSEFDSAYGKAIQNVKSVKKTLFLNAMANLPHDDQKKLSNGEIRYYQEKSYKVGTFSNSLFHTSPKVLMVAKNGADFTTYEFDTEKGSIKRLRDNSKVERSPEYLQNELCQIEEFFPDKTRVMAKEVIDASGNTSPLLRIVSTIAWAVTDIRRSPLDAERTSDQSQANMFSSARASHVADALVSSLDLDNPAFKRSAAGVTHTEARYEQAREGSEFVLNLLPFRSAIKNFQAGNIADGIEDLQLDLFGFLTAGFGAAAKVGNVVSKAGSVLSKAAKTTRILGAAALGELNPLSGVGTVVTGAAKGVYKGAGWVAAKGKEVVNTLKGASGSYDLLEAASKTYGVAATGTFKLADEVIEGGAVLTEGKWYAYDPVRKRPYGSPINDFKPSVAALDGELKAITDSWFGRALGAYLAPAAKNPNYYRDYRAAVSKANADDRSAYVRGQNTGKPSAIYGYSPGLKVDDLKRLAVAETRTPEELGSLGKRIDELEALPDRLKTACETAKIIDLDAYNAGHKAGKPQGITGFSETLSNHEIAELGLQRGRTPEDLGRLVKYVEDRRVNIANQNFIVFKDEVAAAGGRAIPIPQGFYLSQVSLLSEGECAGISAVFAASRRQGKELNFMRNIQAASVPPLSPAEIAKLREVNPGMALIEEGKATRVNKFRDQLNQLQTALQSKFHMNMQERQVPYTTIISELASATSSKTLLINGPGHAITAGVVVTNGKKEWFYFDPNYGYAVFDTEAQMTAGLKSTLCTGRSKSLLPHYGENAKLPEYKISVFQNVELNNTIQSTRIDVNDLFIPSV